MMALFRKIVIYHLASLPLYAVGMPTAGRAPRPESEAACKSSEFQNSYRTVAQYLKQAKLVEALPYLEKAHRVCPSNYSISRNLILAYRKSTQTAKAQALVEELLQKRETAELHLILAEILTYKKSLQAAAAEYQKAAQLDPSEDNLFRFGSSLLSFPSDASVRIFRYGVEKYPQSERLRLGLGSALYGQASVDLAVEEIMKASDMNPADANAMDVLGPMEYIPATMSARVVERLSSLHNLYPQNAKIFYYYVMALSGRWSAQPPTPNVDVIDLLQQVAKLDPRMAEVHFQLGELYTEKDQALDALNAYQKAARLNPSKEKYHYRLALAFKRCGSPNEFRKELELFQKLHDTTK